MSKVICDVCGTAYAETMTQCPICGCAVSADAKIVPGTADEGTKDNGAYTYVKGGRFSKANVSKRNKARHGETAAPANETRLEKRERLNKEREEKSNRGLVITVIALLLAIIAVVAYIVLRFFAPFGSNANVSIPNSTPGIEIQDPTEDTDPIDLSCTAILLTNDTVTLESEGAVVLLDYKLTPADTTELVSFVVEDETVATVDENGKLVAVAPGETVVRIICGSVTVECKVVCAFEVATEPVETEPAPTESVTTEGEYKFNTVFPNEMTLKAGEKFALRLQDANKKSVDAVLTSSKTSVCIITEDGQVKAVAKGTATIKAEYQGKIYKCTVHVN